MRELYSEFDYLLAVELATYRNEWSNAAAAAENAATLAAAAARAAAGDKEDESAPPPLRALKTLNEYDAEIARLMSAVSDIQSRTLNEVRGSLYLVRCGEMKQGLMDKANALAQLILDIVASDAREQNSAIYARYEAMHEQAQKVPQTAEDMIELKRFLETVRDKIKELQVTNDRWWHSVRVWVCESDGRTDPFVRSFPRVCNTAVTDRPADRRYSHGTAETQRLTYGGSTAV